MLNSTAQTITQEKFVQVDGIVYDKQNNTLPNITIVSWKLRKGSTSKTSGIYSIISVPGDTIIFSAIGLKRTTIMIPDSISDYRFFADVYMDYDTISINDVLVLPWRTYAEFKRAVVEADVNSYEVDNMNENLLLIHKQIASDIGISPEAAYRQVVKQMTDASYTRNQYPSNNLLNPFAWAKFMQGLKEGLLRNEKKR
jgi:hypothetical protein